MNKQEQEYAEFQRQLREKLSKAVKQARRAAIFLGIAASIQGIALISDLVRRLL